MKQIPLTRGQFAIVDGDKYEWLNQWKWFANWNPSTQSFYAIRNRKRENGKQSPISMAREILGLERNDKRQADHIDHNTLNNRILNLRIATNSQNQWNRKNAKGYYWHKASKKYLANITVNYKYIYLGIFETTEEAHNAYLYAKKIYHKRK